jgi:hypothetical protein
MQFGIGRIKNAIITIRRSYIRYFIKFIAVLKMAKISQFANCGRLSKERIFPVMKRVIQKNVNIFRDIGVGRQDSIQEKRRTKSFRELQIEFAKYQIRTKTSDRPADFKSSVRRAQRELVNQRNERWTGRSIHNRWSKMPLSRHQWKNEWEYCLFPGSP